MAEGSEYELEPLREEADFTFYRGRKRSDLLPVLAVVVAAEEPSPQSLRRLEHEFSLAKELDVRWAVQPLALTRYRGRAALILEDRGGEPLDRVIERHKKEPVDLTRFLRIAIGLTDALGHAHRQGVIHKDVKPANALVDDSGQARTHRLWPRVPAPAVTERRHAEEALRQAQGDLARINRVTTMGEMAASLAREIRQPLAGTVTNASVCLRRLGGDRPEDEELRAPITRLMRDAERATDIVKRIRSQFEDGSVRKEALGVSELIREAVALLRPEMLRYNVSIRMDLAAALPQVSGDRVQLQQVAMNLMVNGIESMKNVEGPRDLVIRARLGADAQVLVSVSDTGTGFPPQLAERMFDPFFTTKHHGTGMGLRISRPIIESHGGRLWAEAADGRGATFHVGLPAATPGPLGREDGATSRQLRGVSR